MKYKRTPRFKKDYEALPGSIKDKVRKAFKLFQEDQRHPSLHTKKIKGADGIWEGRIDYKYRFTFEYDENGDVLFRRIGPHDVVDEEAQDS